MISDMRRKLAEQSYEEKIRKVGMLIDLIRKAPKLGQQPRSTDVNKNVIIAAR
jgi:hypothetical protein